MLEEDNYDNEISDSEVAFNVKVARRFDPKPPVEVALEVEGRAEPAARQPPQPRGGLPGKPRPRGEADIAGVRGREDAGAGKDGALAGQGWQQVRAYSSSCVYLDSLESFCIDTLTPRLQVMASNPGGLSP